MKKLIIFIFCFFSFNFNVLASSSIVMDMDNGRILYENNSEEIRLIASTTKIMTALLAIESGRLEELVTIGDEVLPMYGSNIYIEKGEQMLLLDLVYGLLLRSGNDASVSIAKFVGNTEEKFISMMNKKAKSLGMKDTTFSNPHGLDENSQNFSTAKDLCILYSYAYKYPIFQEIVKTKNYQAISSLKAYTWVNRNDLLFSYKYLTGGKTGYTPKAGRILISSASYNNINLCMVTFDSNSYLYNFHETKYEYIFNNYKKYHILDKDNLLIEGINKRIYLKNDFYYALTEEEYKNIEVKTNIDKSNKNNVIGEIYVYLDGEIIEKQDIYTDIKEKNIWDKIKTFFLKFLPF